MVRDIANSDFGPARADGRDGILRALEHSTLLALLIQIDHWSGDYEVLLHRERREVVRALALEPGSDWAPLRVVQRTNSTFVTLNMIKMKPLAPPRWVSPGMSAPSSEGARSERLRSCVSSTPRSRLSGEMRTETPWHRGSHMQPELK